jgi:hypothetical protein
VRRHGDGFQRRAYLLFGLLSPVAVIGDHIYDRKVGRRSYYRVQPSWMAVRVNGWAARLLSPAARAQHAEELLDEVYDLAELGAPRRAQTACALRQLARVRQSRVTARSAKRSPSAAGGE